MNPLFYFFSLFNWFSFSLNKWLDFQNYTVIFFGISDLPWWKLQDSNKKGNKTWELSVIFNFLFVLQINQIKTSPKIGLNSLFTLNSNVVFWLCTKSRNLGAFSVGCATDGQLTAPLLECLNYLISKGFNWPVLSQQCGSGLQNLWDLLGMCPLLWAGQFLPQN